MPRTRRAPFAKRPTRRPALRRPVPLTIAAGGFSTGPGTGAGRGGRGRAPPRNPWAAEEKADDFERRYLALKSRADNEHAVTVPLMHRDVDADDQPTAPGGIDVRTLREALNTRAA